MINENIVRAQVERNQVLIIQSPQAEYVNCFANIPVLPETLLLIDLEMQESSVDLGRLTQLVLGDLGATIKILQLANQMYGNADGCLRRIEDCISDLDLNTCIETLSENVIHYDGQHKAILDLWAHSREIAHKCKMIAEEEQDPQIDDAYLLGLFHAIGSLPATLEEGDLQARWADGAHAGVKFVKQWPLPHCVSEFFQARVTGLQTKQLDMLQKAHQRVNRPSIDCAFREHMHRRFLHAV